MVSNLGIGIGIRNAITTVINKGSPVIITPYTQSTTDHGHSGQTPVDGTPVNEIAIPFEEIQRILKQPFGNLKTGVIQLAVKYTTVFEISGPTKYRIEYNGDTYDITQVTRFAPLEDILIAYILTITKRFS